MRPPSGWRRRVRPHPPPPRAAVQPVHFLFTAASAACLGRPRFPLPPAPPPPARHPLGDFLCAWASPRAPGTVGLRRPPAAATSGGSPLAASPPPASPASSSAPPSPSVSVKSTRGVRRRGRRRGDGVARHARLRPGRTAIGGGDGDGGGRVGGVAPPGEGAPRPILLLPPFPPARVTACHTWRAFCAPPPPHVVIQGWLCAGGPRTGWACAGAGCAVAVASGGARGTWGGARCGAGRMVQGSSSWCHCGQGGYLSGRPAAEGAGHPWSSRPPHAHGDPCFVSR